MQLAMAKLVMKLVQTGNKKGLRMLANQSSNKGSVESMITKSINTLSGSKNSKIRPLESEAFAPKGTFTKKFYEDGYNLTDNFHKTDCETFYELMEINPGKVNQWIGPKFNKKNLELL